MEKNEIVKNRDKMKDDDTFSEESIKKFQTKKRNRREWQWAGLILVYWLLMLFTYPKRDLHYELLFASPFLIFLSYQFYVKE